MPRGFYIRSKELMGRLRKLPQLFKPKPVTWIPIYTPSGVQIPLQNSDKMAIIDEDDLPKISGVNWWIMSSGYAFSSRGLMHTVITGYKITDHIEINSKLDNRKENLRPCTRSQNQAHQHKKSVISGFKGVYPQSGCRGKWQARISVNSKKIHLGTFSNKIDAAIAYNNSAKKYYGEFATLNEIPNGAENL